MLTPQQLAEFKGEYFARNLKEFIKHFWHVLEPSAPFVDAYYIDALCDHLTHIKDIRNLLINIPPRLGKSTLINVMWFCWLWAHSPEMRLIYFSYSQRLSERDHERCRRLLSDPLYQAYYGKRFKISDAQNTKARTENNHGGFRLATSLEGQGTGEGGHVIIADDPHKLGEAESKANREAVVRWFTTEFMTRLEDPAKGCRILVQQRVHQEDVSGWLLKYDVTGAWTKLILPLEAGKSRFISTRFKDPREPGELLSPRIPEAEVEFLKRNLGKRAYTAQYNQNPAPPEDALFQSDNLQYYESLPEGGFRIAAVDLAISLKGDYTVMIVADIFSDGSIYIVHLHRERMPGTRIVPTIKQIHQAFKPTIIYIEDVAFQRLIIQEARANKLPVKGFKPEGDKISRSVMAQVKIETHQLYLPKNAPWLHDFEEEISEFPNSVHDDQVDTLSMICIEGNTLSRRIPKKDQQESKEAREKRENEDFNRKIKEDEERFKKAFFEGL